MVIGELIHKRPVVTPTEFLVGPQSLCNQSLNGVLCCRFAFLSVGKGAFVIGLGHISSIFLQ